MHLCIRIKRLGRLVATTTRVGKQLYKLLPGTNDEKNESCVLYTIEIEVPAIMI